MWDSCVSETYHPYFIFYPSPSVLAICLEDDKDSAVVANGSPTRWGEDVNSHHRVGAHVSPLSTDRFKRGIEPPPRSFISSYYNFRGPSNPLFHPFPTPWPYPLRSPTIAVAFPRMASKLELVDSLASSSSSSSLWATEASSLPTSHCSCHLSRTGSSTPALSPWASSWEEMEEVERWGRDGRGGEMREEKGYVRRGETSFTCGPTCSFNFLFVD